MPADLYAVYRQLLVFSAQRAYNPTVENNTEFRKLPSVDELVRSGRIKELIAEHSRKVVVDNVRKALASARESIARGESAPDADAIADIVGRELGRITQMSLTRAINATGIIIHTGLGRAALSDAARRAIEAVAGGHSTLEIDIKTGKRGSRQDHITELIVELTGAENALVVNNNAAAVLLALNTIARDMDVVISRGQLVEIGGSFRLPDIIARAGARLIEVGTTNRTRISDYQQAAWQNEPGLLLRCHPSNFKITGFTQDVSLDELVALGSQLHIPVMDDLGSGALVDLVPYGLEHEPTVQESIESGVDMVTFSGDKLLGASQTGILAGKSEFIDQCRSNPLARALRVDKLTLAALEATLHIYREGDPFADIPVLSAIARPLEEVAAQASKLARRINSLKIDGLNAYVAPSTSETGGGSLPGQSIESRSVALKSRGLSAEDLGRRFREWNPPIFGRITRDTYLLDMRTVNPQELGDIIGRARSLPG
ncbi:MAG: L-seryl-tRNA(Sec) selenium transferase [Armatimonadetes bacterium]|nr:L-seryl-tRNA(Sec) selenium transferase [Armatimonadota bacterium]